MAARGSRALEGAVAASRSESEGRHSGRLLLRMPQSLHSALARAAEREGVSLNQFIATTLAEAVEWQGAGSTPRPERARSRPSGLALALLVNAVVVVAAGLVAVAMLVIAWVD